jgi:D-alanyl-D-alanine carboxypeptidase
MVRVAEALLVVVLVLSAGTANVASGAPSAATPSWATDYANQLMTTGVMQALVFVAGPGHQAFASAGSPLPKIGQRFPSADVAKSFTATVVLQLVQEQKLELSGMLGEYLPGVMAHGSDITIRELLQHRSGLRDMAEDPAALGVVVKAYNAHVSGAPLLHQLSQLSLAFAPGSRWEYSNTNYLALALVIEKVTGHSYVSEVESRVLGPLGLTATSPVTGTGPGTDAGGLFMGTCCFNTDAPDLAQFYQALLSGRLLSAQVLATMEQTDPGGAGFLWHSGFANAANTYVGDGLGIFASDAPCGRFWGHGGDTGPTGDNNGWTISASIGAAGGRAVIAAARLRDSLWASGKAHAHFWAQANPAPLFCSAF